MYSFTDAYTPRDGAAPPHGHGPPTSASLPGFLGAPVGATPLVHATGFGCATVPGAPSATSTTTGPPASGLHHGASLPGFFGTPVGATPTTTTIPTTTATPTSLLAMAPSSVSTAGSFSQRHHEVGRKITPADFPVMYPATDSDFLDFPEVIRSRLTKWIMISRADGQQRVVVILDNNAVLVTGLLLDRIRTHYDSPHLSSCRALLSSLCDRNFAGKGAQFRMWLKQTDLLVASLVTSKFALSDFGYCFARLVRKLEDLNRPGMSEPMKLQYHRALVMATNIHLYYNAHLSSEQLSVDDIMNYDVYYSIFRLRLTLSKFGVFSVEYLQQKYGHNLRSVHIKGIPYAMFLLLDSLIPFTHWRHHLTKDKTLIMPNEADMMSNNPLFHRIR